MTTRMNALSRSPKTAKPGPPSPERARPTAAGRRRAAPDGLESHCARWTGPRDDVFNILVGTQEHLSAMDIFARLRASNPDIGLTTVYRTIDLLDAAGLIRRVSGCGDVRFEYRRGDREDHHHHLICTACRRIINYRDFESEELSLVRRTEERLARKHGFLIRDHNIEFLGLCAECRPGGDRSLIQAAVARPSKRPRVDRGRSSPRKDVP